MKCPKCKSKNTECICIHHNRRKKIPIYLYQCKECRKRFTVAGEKKDYNHSGNARIKNKICYYCHNHFDNDTEKAIGVCLNCLVKNYNDYGHYIGTFDDWLFYVMDYDEYEKRERIPLKL